jgi:hypothetical protein
MQNHWQKRLKQFLPRRGVISRQGGSVARAIINGCSIGLVVKIQAASDRETCLNGRFTVLGRR